MYTKIKLKIELIDSSTQIDDNLNQTDYYLKVTVLDIDDRFQVGEDTGDYLRFRGDFLYVKCNRSKNFGGLFDEGIIIPELDRCGFPYTKYFKSDRERKTYLKKLYSTLDEWSNYWWGFSKDSTSKFIIKDDIWEIQCESIEKKLLYTVF